MNKIVPFKREINFENGIDEIRSISLEHHVLKKEAHHISGDFIINGEYKKNQSENPVPFDNEIPFDITLDTKYNAKGSTIDINDFYYEIKNKKTLSVDIEVIIDNIEEEIVRKPKEEKKEIKEQKENPQSLKQKKSQIEKEVKQEPVNQKEKTIFSELETETYKTYKVHMVTEKDTIPEIIQKYNINEEILKSYNEITDLKKGDKLIIQINENQ